MVIVNFVYLEKVKIYIEKEEDKYILITENASVIDRYETTDPNGLYNWLENIKYYWIEEYEEEYNKDAFEHESYIEMQELLNMIDKLTKNEIESIY